MLVCAGGRKGDAAHFAPHSHARRAERRRRSHLDGVGRRRWRRQLFFENAAEKRGREEYFSSSRNLISQERFFPVRGRGGGDPTVVRDSPNAKKSNVEGVFFYLTGKALNLFHPMG